MSEDVPDIFRTLVILWSCGVFSTGWLVGWCFVLLSYLVYVASFSSPDGAHA